jgi:hypothetical protein
MLERREALRRDISAMNKQLGLPVDALVDSVLLISIDSFNLRVRRTLKPDFVCK